MLSQFRTFSYNQSAFINREIIQPALKGNVAPLVRFMALSIPVGGAITETRNLIQNRPSEENDTKRLIQYFSKAGGIGLAGDVYTGLFPQNGQYLPQDRAVTMALGTIGGPTVGTFADAYGSLSQAVQGKPTSLERFALRQIPLAGPTLQNTLLPYKTKSGGDTAGTSGKGKPGATPEQMLAVANLLEDPETKSKITSSGNAKLSARQQKALIATIKKLVAQGQKGSKARLPKLPKPKNLATTKVSRKAQNPIRKLSQADIQRIAQLARS